MSLLHAVQILVSLLAGLLTLYSKRHHFPEIWRRLTPYFTWAAVNRVMRAVTIAECGLMLLVLVLDFASYWSRVFDPQMSVALFLTHLRATEAPLVASGACIVGYGYCNWQLFR